MNFEAPALRGLFLLIYFIILHEWKEMHKRNNWNVVCPTHTLNKKGFSAAVRKRLYLLLFKNLLMNKYGGKSKLLVGSNGNHKWHIYWDTAFIFSNSGQIMKGIEWVGTRYFFD